MDTALAPFVAESTGDVVDVAGGASGARRRERAVEDHDCTAMDEQSYLCAELGEDACLEVVEEFEEVGAGERDLVVCSGVEGHVSFRVWKKGTKALVIYDGRWGKNRGHHPGCPPSDTARLFAPILRVATPSPRA